METYAGRTVAITEVNLEHNLAYIRFYIKRIGIIRRIESSSVIDPLEIKDVIL